MVNHLSRAKELRSRAAQYEISAQNTTSKKFEECYRLLAENFLVLATLEEEYVQREVAARTAHNFSLMTR